MKLSKLILFSAFLVASCGAYFSIWGLSQLFAGASISVIIMASVLEFSKVLVTTVLHRYRSELPKVLKRYLTISVIVLMLITSMGIFGFLTSAYQATANRLEIHENNVEILKTKKNGLVEVSKGIDSLISNKNKRINLLSSLRVNQELRLDNGVSKASMTNARSDIESSTNEIKHISHDIDSLNDKNSIIRDSIGKISTDIIALSANSTISAEVGPLKYLSTLTGLSIGVVVGILVLLIIGVFDPLAMALILMANNVSEIEAKKELENKVEEIVPEKEEEPVIEEPIIENVPPIEEVEEVTEPVVAPTPTEEPKKEPKQKIRREDIKEIKNSNNAIERIGANKTKNGDSVVFKRN